MNKPHRLHIGHLIKEVVDEKEISVTKLAEKGNNFA